ncbi:MAG: acyl-CoA dehydrogenase family protein [bacterium]
MKSPYFTKEHDLFRQTVREFMAKEVKPNADQWEQQQRIPRAIWEKMGALGFLGINFPEKYGGAEADFFYSVVFLEEIGRTALGGFAAAVAVQQYMATAHIFRTGSEALKQKFLAPSNQGKKVGALAITEPNTGSDVAAIRTRAVREGDHYVIDGGKTFITNGVYGDFVTVAVKTNPDAGVDGVSLIVVDTDTKGYTAKKLQKMGWHCSDTAEISFAEVRVPAANLIGQENMGFYYMMESFQLERLVAALQAIGGCEYCLEITLKYITEREAFGRPLAKFQTIRHKLADLATELEAARRLTYHAAWLHGQDEHAVKECSMAKLLCSELANKIIDSCLQFFGGYGYMAEYEISRMYRDARVGTIVGGASEIMREIISKILIDGMKYDSVYESEKPAQGAKVAEPVVAESPAKKPETAAEIFQTLPKRFKPEKAGDWQTVFHFDISGEDGGQFTVTIKDGSCTVETGLHGTPKCVVKSKAKTYRDIEFGKTNPQTAFMLGKVKVSSIPEMMQFAKMFRPLTET